MGDLSNIQAIERKVKIPYDRYATSTPIFQLTTPTLKISVMTIKVLDACRGSVGSLAIGRESVLVDGPGYRRTKGGPKELKVSAEAE
jgi:hypothetical protein